MSEVSFPFGQTSIDRDGGLFFIFEMANNHQGSVEHGLEIVRAVAEIAREREVSAAMKFQFRQMDSFLHSGYFHSRLEVSSNKHSKRFQETRLSYEQFESMVEEARSGGLEPLATPFDEASVDWCESMKLPAIKIASCSATDWPLLSRIAEAQIPVICSTGGLSLQQIDEVVDFFRKRDVPLTILHCVALYPVPRENVQMDQVRQLRQRYPDVVIGYSGHEAPEDVDIAALAVANGAAVVERHVGLPTETISLNKYSSAPADVAKWVDAALRARTVMDAGKPRVIHESERESLDGLKRGIFVNVDKAPGEFFQPEDLILRMPCLPGQYSSTELDEVIGMPVPHGGVAAMMPILKTAGVDIPPEIRISSIRQKVLEMLASAKVAVPADTVAEISHPYGLARFGEFGAVIIDVVNREYCKKLIVQVPGQDHPTHKHIKKEETFQVLSGELESVIGGEVTLLKAGDKVTVHREAMHSFRTQTGMIMEEISTTHVKGDSIYEDEGIPSDPTTRKSAVSL